MSKNLKLYITISLILIGTWLYATPYLTISTMKKAYENNDATKFSSYVNYPSLRESFKNTFKAAINKEMMKDSDKDGLGNLGKAFSIAMASAFIDSLVESFVFYKVNRFDLKGKKQLATQEKYYIVDPGLLNILIGKERITDRGHILENVVYLELLRRGYKIWTGSSRNSEVDFVCKTPTGDIEYYQVAWEMSNEKTIEREFGSLEKISDNYPKYILTTESFTVNRSGINHLNVFNWLLEERRKY